MDRYFKEYALLPWWVIAWMLVTGHLKMRFEVTDKAIARQRTA